MSFARLRAVRQTFGFRLGVWFSVLFLLSTLPLLALTYILLSSSLEQRARERIDHELQELAVKYQTGGLRAMEAELVYQEQHGLAKRFLIRVVSPGSPPRFLRFAERWNDFDLRPLDTVRDGPGTGWIVLSSPGGRGMLEVGSLRMPDGTILQVAKATKGREEVLVRFRSQVAGVMIPALVVSVCAAVLLVRRALRPLREVIATVQAIEGGTMDARVSLRQTGDELDELGRLFNAMLDRIAVLVSGMRGALDTVAHELRTPVTRIRGVAEVALRSDHGPEGLRQALADCVEGSDELLTILNTLMDISEAESGALKLKLEAVDVSTLVDDTVDLYRHVADEKRIALETAVPPGLWLTADRSRLRQVLANLLDNAIKYTPNGGWVRVHASKRHTGVTLSVADSGIGVAADEIAKIWDRLYRGAHSHTERGLGLGLSLVRAIVRAHGGETGVASVIGKGSTFTISLPPSAASG
jgi:signal transduction histidine kinase